MSKLRENAKHGDRRGREELDLGPAVAQLRRIHLLRRPRARSAPRRRQARRAQDASRSRNPAAAAVLPTRATARRKRWRRASCRRWRWWCETFDALVSERGDTGKIWASLLKDTLKRRRPDFSETYYGFRTFGNLLEDAQARGLFEFGRDEKSGTYVFRSAQAAEALGAASDSEQAAPESLAPDTGAADRGDELGAEKQGEQPSEVPAAAPAREPRRRGGRGRKGREQGAEQPVAVADVQSIPEDTAMASWPAPTPDLVEADDAAEDAQAEAAAAAMMDALAGQPAAATKERRRAPRKPAARKGKAAAEKADAAVTTVEPPAAAEPVAVHADTDTDVDAVTDADPSDPAPVDGQGAQERKASSRPKRNAAPRKPAARARRPAKPKTPEGA